MIWYTQDRKVATKNIGLKGKVEDKQFWKKNLKPKETEMLLEEKKGVKYWYQQDLKILTDERAKSLRA